MSECLIGPLSLHRTEERAGRGRGCPFDISAVEEIKLNTRGRIKDTHDTETCRRPRSPLTVIWKLPHQMLIASGCVPFVREAPVGKLIRMIIERGFNEGEMFLTFECHGLPLPAVLLSDKANGFQK